MKMKPILFFFLVVATVTAVFLEGKLRDLGIRNPKNPNVLSIKASPYGKVVAYGMQGGIELYHHQGNTHEHNHDKGGDYEGHTTNAEHKCVHHEGHKDCLDCSHDHSAHKNHIDRSPKLNRIVMAPLREKSLRFFKKLENIRVKKTNPEPVSEHHDFYLRRKTENRLRLAYEMDPSNYENYNNYNGIIQEFGRSTRVKSFEASFQLSKQTIEYCLRQENDLFAQLTGASACADIMTIFFFEKDYSRKELAEYCVKNMERFMKRYMVIKVEMKLDHRWELFSPVVLSIIDDADVLNAKRFETCKLMLTRDFN